MKSTKIYLGLGLLGATVGVALNMTRVEAAPMIAETAKIPLGASYRDYAVSDDTATFDGEKFDAEREKLGFPMSMIFNGDRRAQEVKNGYVTVFATGAQTTLRVPLGWFAFEAIDKFEDSVVRSPDETVRIVARLPLDSVAFQSERNAFLDLKKLSSKTLGNACKSKN